MKNVVQTMKKTKIADMARKAKFSWELSAHKKTKEKYGYEIIRLVDEIGQKLNVGLWIEWGTLLGLVREGRLIGHDYDIDFATYKMNDNEYCRFFEMLKAAGFELTRQFKYQGYIISETYDYKGTLVDFDYCEADKGKMVYFEYDIGSDTVIEKASGLYTYRNMDVLIYYAEEFSLVRGTFQNGVSCNIPCNAEKHIEFLYGEDWRTPNPDFDCRELHNYELSRADANISGWRRV